MSLVRLFEMSTYAGYVWSAYGITFLGLAVIVWLAHQRLEQERSDARRRRQSRD